jgi:P-type E1-E2 ATPase
MIEVTAPGRGTYELEHLLLDLTGTIALDGEVLPAVAGRLAALSDRVAIHLVTADTHGNAEQIAERLGVRFAQIKPLEEGRQKAVLAERLGASRVVAIGNGANDAQVLSTAALGIAVLGPEGLAVEALQAADLVVGRIEDALDLLLNPSRLAATLRR